MAQITINIPDDKIQDLLDAFAYVQQPAQGVTKAQNAREQLRDYLLNIYKSYRKAQELQNIQSSGTQQINESDSVIEADAAEITVN